MRYKDEQPIKKLVEDMFKQYKLNQKFNEQKLIHSWERIMGKAIANHTIEISIRNKTLFLKLDSSVLRNELTYGKHAILKMLNDAAETEVITDIYFT